MRRLAALLVLLPGAALAHASERMVILTLPTGRYILGAGVAVALTALVGLVGRRLPAFGSRVLFDRPVLVPRGVTSWIGAVAFWALIAVGILAAHLLAVVLGLKIAQRFAGGDRFATHLPMTVLMIGYTVLGLWLLSSPTAG